MDLIKVKKNFQITIPQSIRKILKIEEGQFMEVEVNKENNLVLKPVKITRKNGN